MKTIICDICKRPIYEKGVEIKKKEIIARKYYFVHGFKKEYAETTMDICESCICRLEKEISKGE